MKFNAKIEANGKKVFEACGDKSMDEILAGMDSAVEKEIMKGK